MEKISKLIEQYTDTRFKIVSKTQGDNHFINQTITIVPVNGSDMEIEVSLNDRGDISTVDSNRVKLKQFNIAEGYTQSEMAMGIAALLSGSYEVQNRNLFGRRTVIISVGNSKVYGLQVISKTKPGKI